MRNSVTTRLIIDRRRDHVDSDQMIGAMPDSRDVRLVTTMLVLAFVLAACSGVQQSPSASVPASARGAPSSPSPSVPPPSATPAPVPSASVPAGAQAESRILRVQAAGVRLRAGPNATAHLLASLPAGARVVRTEAAPVDADDLAWYEVRFGGTTGWVASGPEGEWLASVENGRIGFACTGCGEGGSRAAVTVEPDGSDRRVLLPTLGWPIWSPDGERVVIEHVGDPGSSERGLTLMAADGSGADPLGPGTGAAWSPDGEWLAFSNYEAGTLVVIDPDGRRFDLIVNDHGAPGALAWSPDGSRLAFAAIDCDECPVGEPIMGDVPSGIYLFQPPMGEVERVVTRGYYGNLTWSADGSSLTYFSTDLSVGGNEIRRVNLADGAVTTLASDSWLLSGWEAAPDGTRLVLLSEAGVAITAPDGRDGRVVVPRTEDQDPTPMHPRWSPDGQWIMYDMARVTGDAIETWIVRADGSGQPQRVSEDAHEAAWQPVLVPLTE